MGTRSRSFISVVVIAVVTLFLPGLAEAKRAKRKKKRTVVVFQINKAKRTPRFGLFVFKGLKKNRALRRLVKIQKDRKLKQKARKMKLKVKELQDRTTLLDVAREANMSRLVLLEPEPFFKEGAKRKRKRKRPKGYNITITVIDMLTGQTLYTHEYKVKGRKIRRKQLREIVNDMQQSLLAEKVPAVAAADFPGGDMPPDVSSTETDPALAAAASIAGEADAASELSAAGATQPTEETPGQVAPPPEVEDGATDTAQEPTYVVEGSETTTISADSVDSVDSTSYTSDVTTATTSTTTLDASSTETTAMVVAPTRPASSRGRFLRLDVGGAFTTRSGMLEVDDSSVIPPKYLSFFDTDGHGNRGAFFGGTELRLDFYPLQIKPTEAWYGGLALRVFVNLGFVRTIYNEVEFSDITLAGDADLHYKLYFQSFGHGPYLDLGAGFGYQSFPLSRSPFPSVVYQGYKIKLAFGWTVVDVFSFELGGGIIPLMTPDPDTDKGLAKQQDGLGFDGYLLFELYPRDPLVVGLRVGYTGYSLEFSGKTHLGEDADVYNDAKIKDMYVTSLLLVGLQF